MSCRQGHDDKTVIAPSCFCHAQRRIWVLVDETNPIEMTSASSIGARLRCEESADRTRHLGPFEHLYRVEHPRQPIDAETCLACGSTVIRKAKPLHRNKKRPKKPKTILKTSTEPDRSQPAG